MRGIWEACRDRVRPGLLSGTLLRLVESQEQIATNQLVDDLDEQRVLEDLLEQTKPPGPKQGPRHYLLRTPFRYPPLRHGSRFGSRHEPSLFYGSLSTGALLAEAAFYRFYFWHGMESPPAHAFVTQHTAFEVGYAAGRGVRLQATPFDEFRAALAHPADYSATQALGSAMREAGIEAFEYRSARDPDGGLNVALFTPGALADARPRSQERWLCQTEGERVRFLGNGTTARDFPLAAFLVEGELPDPAP